MGFAERQTTVDRSPDTGRVTRVECVHIEREINPIHVATDGQIALSRSRGRGDRCDRTPHLAYDCALGAVRSRGALRPSPSVAESRALPAGIAPHLLCFRPSPSCFERARAQRYTSTGILLWVRTLTVWLPKTTADIPLRPCDAIMIKSHPLFWAVSMMPR